MPLREPPTTSRSSKPTAIAQLVEPTEHNKLLGVRKLRGLHDLLNCGSQAAPDALDVRASNPP
jgi:hypothetical protein